jgi:hypothetical protein
LLKSNIILKRIIQGWKMRILLLLIISVSLCAQDLLSERIRKLSGKKMMSYQSDGIFHNGQVGLSSTLQAVRHGVDSKNGYERVVFDFTTNEIPRVYGHVSAKNKKLYLDFFNSSLMENLKTIGDSENVEHIYFYPIDSESLSVEVILKSAVKADIFYLSNPGRLVIDLKK